MGCGAPEEVVFSTADAMQEQYRWSFGQIDRFHPAFYEHFVLATFATRPTMVLVTHAAALIVILLAFLSRRFIQTGSSSHDQAERAARHRDPANH